MKNQIRITLIMIAVVGLSMSVAQTSSAQRCLSDIDCPPPNACVTQAHCVRPFEEGKANAAAVSHANPRGIERAGLCQFARKKHCCVSDSDCVVSGSGNALTCDKQSKGKKTTAGDTGRCSEVKNVGKKTTAPAGKTTAQGKSTTVTPIKAEENTNLRAASEKLNEILEAGDTAVVAERTLDSETGEPVFSITLVQEEAGEEVKLLEMGTAFVEPIEKLSLTDPKITFNILSSPEDTTTVGLEPNSIVASQDLVVSKIADSSLQLSTIQKLLDTLAPQKTSAPTESTDSKIAPSPDEE